MKHKRTQIRVANDDVVEIEFESQYYLLLSINMYYLINLFVFNVDFILCNRDLLELFPKFSI